MPCAYIALRDWAVVELMLVRGLRWALRLPLVAVIHEWVSSLCLTAGVFSAMVSYRKKGLPMRDTPLSFWGFATFSVVESVEYIIYISKCICISIHIPWHLELLWHPFKGVYGSLKGKQGISWWTVYISLLGMKSIYRLSSAIINYHISSIIISWRSWNWGCPMTIAYIGNMMLYTLSIYRRVRLHVYWFIWFCIICVMCIISTYIAITITLISIINSIHCFRKNLGDLSGFK